MIKKAEEFAEQDKQKKEAVEAANQAENVVHDVETKIEEYQSQLPAEEVTKIRELITKTRETLANKDALSPDEIRNATNNLQQSSLKLFEMAYKKVRTKTVKYITCCGGYSNNGLKFQMASEREGGSSSSSEDSSSSTNTTDESEQKKENKN